MPVQANVEPAGLLTLSALRGMRGKILDAASRRGLGDVRVFGSVARDEAGDASDVDLLVAPGPQTTLLDLSGFALEVEDIVGRHVDVATPRGLKARIRATASNGPGIPDTEFVSAAMPRPASRMARLARHSRHCRAGGCPRGDGCRLKAAGRCLVAGTGHGFL